MSTDSPTDPYTDALLRMAALQVQVDRFMVNHRVRNGSCLAISRNVLGLRGIGLAWDRDAELVLERDALESEAEDFDLFLLVLVEPIVRDLHHLLLAIGLVLRIR